MPSFISKDSKAKKKAFPSSIHPMLATLTKDYFFKNDWIYERKFDGERCIAMKKGKNVTLKSRNNLSLNTSYPEIKEALEKLIAVKSIILDGEVCAFHGKTTSFSQLQTRMHVADISTAKKSPIKVYYYIFDILYADDYDLTHLPLIERKHILKKVMRFKDPIRYTEYKFKTAMSYFTLACKKGWEGLIAKDINAPYYHKRSKAWLKFKCVANQELVIGGYTDPKGSRTGFGALLLGYYKNGKLHYAGKVGTGYDEATLKALSKEFKKIATTKCPFINYDDPLKGINWVKPILVAEIAFENWTKHNKLRHARYQGLRRDKKAKNVRQEKTRKK